MSDVTLADVVLADVVLADVVDASALVAAASDGAPLQRLIAADRLSAWCESVRLECVLELEARNESGALEEASSRTPHENESLRRRACVAKRSPDLLSALQRGATTPAHLDQLAATLRRLDPAQQTDLLAQRARMVAAATSTHANEFARWLREEERRLGRRAGVDTLEQQQRSVRMRGRTDRATGMRVYTLSLDPVSGLSFDGRLDAATEALFHDRTPALCPTDPIERQGFLRAHALLELLNGNGGRPGRPEIVVVLDTTVPDGPPHVDWGLPVEIPERVLLELWGRADVCAVVVRNGVVIHAPGQLDLGRSTRLANRAQRRALRAMYARCAIAGCDTAFDRCKIHHVRWWRHGGATDLYNLLPLCPRHHHLVHEGGWQLTLASDRSLTVRQPNGRVRTTGPPRRWAA